MGAFGFVAEIEIEFHLILIELNLMLIMIKKQMIQFQMLNFVR